MFPKVCKNKNCTFNTPDAKGRCAASYSDFELAGCPYSSTQKKLKDLEKKNEQLTKKNDSLTVALESAQAAIWDAFYGKCIAKEYVWAVDKEIRLALKRNKKEKK